MSRPGNSVGECALKVRGAGKMPISLIFDAAIDGGF